LSGPEASVRPRRSRWSIAFVVFALTWGVAATMTATLAIYDHWVGRAAEIETAAAAMDKTAEILRLRIEGRFRPVELLMGYSSEWAEFGAPTTEDGHPLRHRFVRILTDMEQVSAIDAGWDNGDFFLIGRARDRTDERLWALDAPPDAVFVEETVLHAGRFEPLLIARFLDAGGGVLKTVHHGREPFDPRTRPWFVNAHAGEGVVFTDVYEFGRSGNYGFSLSQRSKGGVVGVNITLAMLDRMLDEMPEAADGLLAIVSQGGETISRAGAEAHAGDERLGPPQADTALGQLLALDPAGLARPVDLDGREWIARTAELQLGGGAHEHLYVAMPVDILVAPLVDALHRSALIAAALLIASGPLIWLIARRISVPLSRLALEAEEIRRFELARPANAGSPVSEILDLELAMERMRANLRTFAMYVPKALAKQLAGRGEIPEVGGERREITVLFLDMENFTAMSERLEPEIVMERMSAYFEAATGVLLAHSATIDKFMGDAVMAFWNAPEDVPDHVAAACSAAVDLQAALQPLTAAWSADGGKPLRTRIGIHTGPAIVGNVGSSDRMNFTALGATVNLAARFENLNREMRTSILVSGAVASAVDGRFVLRAAGEMEIRGFSQAMPCFELVGRAAGETVAA